MTTQFTYVQRRRILHQLCVYLLQQCSESGAYCLVLVGLTSSTISCFFFYYPKAKVHNVSDGSFDWDSEAKYYQAWRGEEAQRGED